MPMQSRRNERKRPEKIKGSTTEEEARYLIYLVTLQLFLLFISFFLLPSRHKPKDHKKVKRIENKSKTKAITFKVTN